MYEHHTEPLLPRLKFYLRLLNHTLASAVILLVSLGIGVFGYHWIGTLSWVDSVLNASMILGGMGPVAALTSDASKLFASAYALFSGMVFLVVAGIVVVPVAHRILHYMHIDGGN